MPTTWDETKRRVNLDKHGLDFADFDTCFDGETALYLPATPSSTGRTRYRVIGDWDGTRVVAVIVSPLGSEVLSLVSLRIASPKERAAYARHREQA